MVRLNADDGPTGTLFHSANRRRAHCLIEGVFDPGLNLTRHRLALPASLLLRNLRRKLRRVPADALIGEVEASTQLSVYAIYQESASILFRFR